MVVVSVTILTLEGFDAIMDMLAALVGSVFTFLESTYLVGGMSILHLLVGAEFLYITLAFISKLRSAKNE